ncbi:uncharacterized protein A1O9_09116 [Exophiala aquamarina CBS 119918]|uniref:Uncharacterized protein n=1 Tax=Exophiala aquamarina CBS 119918 TaxID=1182545 RepID=A0A072P3G9_9EURO|nr:uncharacterized protein A1O9_09116 [Exophiala aquamarina CBS 119918]KEF54674.1 hypothetical protein A1O9_09116 [Exophiala aquamarina CBS 119918]
MSSHPAAQDEQPQPQPSQTQIYHGLSTYPFAQDPEYQSGLATILGHPERAASPQEIEQEVELVLQVQCFYFARKYNLQQPVDPVAYRAWLRERNAALEQDPQPRRPPQSQPAVAVATAPPTQAAPPADDQQPPYPTSFAAIVDLITRNIPVPGIEEIPTTVLEPGSSKIDKTPRRRKPWEKDAETDPDQDEIEVSKTGVDKLEENAAENGAAAAGGAESSAAADMVAGAVDVNGHRETGTGVVNILKPNAVPDSGLLSKD